VRGLLLLACLLGAAPARADEYDARPGLMPAGGILIFYDSQGPLSAASMSPKEVPADAQRIADVKGRSCQYGLSVPLSLSLRATSLSGVAGNGGYKKALERMKKDYPGLKGIYDAKVDLHTISVLGIFRMTCTEILARGFK
jgi:hypothetical protein